ncbi:phosphatase PAP2 family protein [Microterricola viridarii]|uniref:Undecaprenyl-diphosphatase n=1 Tax=Microterricola viridarii TaxID=412690 RepID=A0A1H1Z6A9_9MICO|nr:phosphatase PAP2 family protein [Microterricola viridarii]SDT29052.1 undecaprenyl-diphosphatase [Microterricola viridarii]
MTAASGIRTHSPRRRPLIVGAAAVLLAVLLGAGIMLLNGGAPLAIDAAWQSFMVSMRSPFTEGLALFLNSFGGGIVAVLVVPLSIVAMLLLLRRPWAALFSVATALAGTLGVQLLKNLFARPRPEDILVHSDFGSFPSGHTANAAVIAVTLSLLFPVVWVRIAGVAYVLLMAWSRTLLGAHWLSDTVGGALIGAGVVLLLWAFSARWLEAERLARARARPAD